MISKTRIMDIKLSPRLKIEAHPNRGAPLAAGAVVLAPTHVVVLVPHAQRICALASSWPARWRTPSRSCTNKKPRHPRQQPNRHGHMQGEEQGMGNACGSNTSCNRATARAGMAWTCTGQEGRSCVVSRHDELQHRRGLLALARPHPRRAQHRLGLVALALHRSELGLVELALRLIELNAPRDEQLTSFAFVLWSSAVACRPGSRMRTRRRRSPANEESTWFRLMVLQR